MNFSKLAIALIATSATAFAQPAKTDKAPAPAPPAKDAKPAAGAPATPPAKDAKAATPPAKDAKAADKAAAPAMPTAPTEVADLGKVATGTWKCKGEAFERDGSKVPVTATNKTKVDLDKWWISESLEVKGMKTGVFKLNTFTTFDASSKKWRRVGVDNGGGQFVGTADATEQGKPMTFNLDVIGPMGGAQFRDHVDPSDLKGAGLKVWGEMSMDKGKTWTKVYEMACKK
jgi:hypothetical protein